MFVIIDMGYLMFYRLHATTRWMSFQNEFKGQEMDEHVLLTYFQKHLVSQLDKLKKKYKCPFFFCKDTSQATIWRKQEYPDYKATRGQATPMIHHIKEVLDSICLSYGSIFSIDSLEADDIAYLLVKHIRNIPDHQHTNLVIITSDRDYLQMKDEHITILDGTGKEMKSSGNAHADKLMKILAGDPSDNIPPICKGCGKKTALALASDPQALHDYLQKNNCITAFQRNEKLICMQHIPSEFVNSFHEKYTSTLTELLRG